MRTKAVVRTKCEPQKHVDFSPVRKNYTLSSGASGASWTFRNTSNLTNHSTQAFSLDELEDKSRADECSV
jgi:hypothetical protein